MALDMSSYPALESLRQAATEGAAAAAAVVGSPLHLNQRRRDFDSLLRCVFSLFVVFLVFYIISFLVLNRYRRKGTDDDVDRTSLPFQICCLCLSFSLATTVAVPVTTMSYTQISQETNSWLDAERFVQMLWSFAVTGSDVCLYLLLPFAYFYTESSWSPRRRAGDTRHTRTASGILAAWWKQFVGRLVTSVVEVALLAVILSGVFFIIQIAIDGGTLIWAYPTKVVSTVHILPGLLGFLLFTPVGLRKLMSTASARRGELTTRPSTIAQAVSIESYTVSSLERRLATAMEAERKHKAHADLALADQAPRSRPTLDDLPAWMAAPVSPQPARTTFREFAGDMSPLPSPLMSPPPVTTRPRSRSAGTNTSGSPWDAPSGSYGFSDASAAPMSFAAFVNSTDSRLPPSAGGRGPPPRRSASLGLARSRSLSGSEADWLSEAGGSAAASLASAVAGPSSAGTLRRRPAAGHREHQPGSATGSQPRAGGTGSVPSLSETTMVSVAELKAELAAATARRDKAVAEQRRAPRWLAWTLYPFRALLGWMVQVVPLVLSGAVVVMAFVRPLGDLAAKEAFLFDMRPLYQWAFGLSSANAAIVAFVVDTVCVGYFVAASVVGAYFSNSVHGMSLQFVRPAVGNTSMQQIVVNLCILQLLSYSLPAAAWILGLGAFDVMQKVATHFGHVAILRNSYFVLMYNGVFVLVAAWLVVVAARERCAIASNAKVGRSRASVPSTASTASAGSISSESAARTSELAEMAVAKASPAARLQ